MKCPRCQADNRDGARFCRECGTTFAAVCPSCGAKVEAGRNPWQQPRPYHCSGCPEANADNKQEGWWKTDSVKAAENCRTHGYHSPPSGRCCLLT
jgi:hypothetical protein